MGQLLPVCDKSHVAGSTEGIIWPGQNLKSQLYACQADQDQVGHPTQTAGRK